MITPPSTHTLECWTECHSLPILIPKGKSNEFEQNVHEPGSFISCNEMLPPCHKWTNTICLRQNGASHMKKRTVFCLLNSRHRGQMPVDCSCRTNDSDEDSVRLRDVYSGEIRYFHHLCIVYVTIYY